MKTLLLLSFFLFFTPFYTKAQPISQAGEAKDVVITFYNSNYAGIFENRTVRLQKGTNRIIIDDIPLNQEIRGMTVFFDGKLLESRHTEAFSNIIGLLPKMTGEKITIHADEPITGTIQRFRANLLELLLDDGSLQLIPNISQYRVTIHKPEILENLHAPLELTVHANKSGRQQLHVFYVTNSMGWSAEHRIVLDEKSSRLKWQAYASLENNTSNGYENATLRFFSGQINLQSHGSPRPYAARMASESATMDADVMPASQESTGDHYIYTYNRKSNVDSGQSTRIMLHDLNEIAYTKKYTHQLAMYGSERNNSRPVISLNIETEGDNGLNTDLPAGFVRFMVNEDDDTPIVRGEQQLPFITPGDKLDVVLGRASDITISELRESDYNRSQKFTDYTLTTTVKNNRDEAVLIEMPQQLAHNMEILSSDIKPERTGDTLKYMVSVDAKSERTFVIKYRQFQRN